MNEGLLQTYKNHPEFEKILKKLNQTGCSAIYEIAEGERAFLTAAIAKITNKPIVLITPSSIIAQRHAQDIERLCGMSCAILPPRDIEFSRATSSRESTYQRLDALDKLASSESKILCVSVEALLDRCASKKQFQLATLTLNVGEKIPPSALLKHLLSVGYERLPMVEGRGQCSIRGALVDIFPPNANEAIRIEFFDDEIDTIRKFDIISQRSNAQLKQIRIAPATECLIEDTSKSAARLQSAIELGHGEFSENILENEDNADALESLDLFVDELKKIEVVEDMLYANKPNNDIRNLIDEAIAGGKKHLDDVALVEAGQQIKTATMWLNTLLEETVFATDYLSEAIIICDRPEGYLSRIHVRQQEFFKAYEQARVRGDAFLAQADELLQYEDFVEQLNSKTVIALSELKSSMGQLKPDTFIEMQSIPTLPYESKLDILGSDIQEWKKKGLCTVILTGGEARAKRLQKVLADEEIPSVLVDSLEGNIITGEVVLMSISYHKGFINPGAHLCVISDSDLYGTAYQRAKKKVKVGEKIASFTDLSVGDYVVHDTHGVGLYLGVVQRKNDNTTRDYLQIQYAEQDKLYVPCDQFDRVTKFIGSEHNQPRLNRIGGGEWKKQTNKVRTGLKKLAFNLVELYKKREQQTGYAYSHNNPWRQEFDDSFPYELTQDQVQCIAEIEADMESERNMERLLCGDVGYGKTEVALRAAFKAVVEGKQVALVAPTTILVQQHYQTICKRFAGFPVRCEMLSRFKTRKEQNEILERLKKGEIDIIVATHRLLGKDVCYNDLGLLIIDEEHRFGVAHKEKIKLFKTQIDVLTLSATPIPRTLHMSMMGIRDLSVIETPPEERLPIKTYVIEYDDTVIKQAITREINRGGQVFFLYNKVRGMEKMHDRLQKLLPQIRIGIAHGQMRENALEDVMVDFYAGAYDVLLCTTIIENGIDVPDANTLIVFEADHFGLSQLYQIRGRVGRSNKQAYAYFTYLRNGGLTEMAEKRLSAIREFTEFGAGHRIAMRDLEIRGAGDVLGPEQSGHLSTIGYDMYLKLVEQAVLEAQGIELVPELDTRIELKIDAYLPEDFVEGERLRVEIYKRIAMIDSRESRNEIEDELIDRFGNIPIAVENLMRIAELRSITRKLGISHVSLRKDLLVMRLDEKYISDLAVFYEAVSTVDGKIHFLAGKQPSLAISEKNLQPKQALLLAIHLLGKVQNKIEKLTK